MVGFFRFKAMCFSLTRGSSTLKLGASYGLIRSMSMVQHFFVDNPSLRHFASGLASKFSQKSYVAV